MTYKKKSHQLASVDSHSHDSVAVHVYQCHRPEEVTCALVYRYAWVGVHITVASALQMTWDSSPIIIAKGRTCSMQLVDAVDILAAYVIYLRKDLLIRHDETSQAGCPPSPGKHAS